MTAPSAHLLALQETRWDELSPDELESKYAAVVSNVLEMLKQHLMDSMNDVLNDMSHGGADEVLDLVPAVMGEISEQIEVQLYGSESETYEEVYEHYATFVPPLSDQAASAGSASAP